MVTKVRFELKKLVDFGGRFIYSNTRENTIYNRICAEHMDYTMKRFLIKMGTIFMSFSLAIIGPIRAYLIYGAKTTTIEARIPFCEPDSGAEFMFNFLLQIVIAAHGILAFCGLEIILSLFENVVTVAPKLIVKSDLVQTIELFETKSISRLELCERIKQIVKASTDTDK